MGNYSVLIDIGFVLTYALFGFALLGAIASGVRALIANPKGAKSVLIGVVALLAVAFISFGLSSGTGVSEALLERTETAAWVVRPVGAGLISFYILLGCSFLLLAGTEIWKPFKK